MKKFLPVILSFFTFFLFFFLLPSSVLGATCPPIGTNVATNFDRKNLEFIAKNANCSGPIPITIIITPALVQNTNLLIQVQKDLRELNFNPTWRPWGFVDPSSSELQDWIDAFSLLKIGQLQTWNEWNRYKEAGSLDPVRDAMVVQALLDARDAGIISIPIGNTPLDILNFTDMHFTQYWRAFHQACPTCIERLDFIVSNVYAPSQYGPNSVQEFIKTWQKELDFLRNELKVDLTGKFFIISEAGLAPGAYTNFDQRLKDTLLFAQKLEEYILAHPGEFPNLDQITFLLMNDETGEQYLIYRKCDDQGNCTWEVANYLVININVPGSLFDSLFPFGSLSCTPEDGGDYDSRPVPCDSCNLTDNFCPSCATSFTVHDTVTYERGDGTKEPPHCVRRKWGGIVTIDPSDTTIPFVGYKGEDDDDKSDYEQKYLADYFEGTNEYYQNYEQYWLDWINHAGVLRKLTPMTYQDELKKSMVQRAIETKEKNAQEEGVHDYNLNYVGRLCWDAPFWVEATGTILGHIGNVLNLPDFPDFSNYCIFEDSERHPEQFALVQLYKYTPLNIPFIKERYSEGIKGTLTELANHFPPDPKEKDYEIKYKEWQEAENGKWSKLWIVAPLVSRDDTVGYIMPYYGYKSDDIPKDIEPQVEDVPHVARLAEATQEINNMFLTQWDSSLMFAQSQTGPIIASPGEIKLLAQNATATLEIRSITCSGGSCRVVIDGSGYGHAWVTINGQFMGINALGPGLTYTIGSPGPGGTACISVSAINYDIGTPDGHLNDTESCCMTLDENGTGTCKGEPYEPPETCSVSGPLIQVSNCELPAITDPNDNDKLCCDEECKINIPLTAVDAWENPEYEKCRQEGLDCKPIPGCVPDPKSKDPNQCEKCKDPCEEIIEKSVERDFGTRLLHPHLTQIWEQTGKLETNGLFNIFRPAIWPEFREMDAASEIQFYYKDSQSPEDITPSEGRFYYNYLGGVQLAKEWVTKSLVPKDEDKNLLQWILGTIVQ
ncbi:MAG: hypothetical protein A2Z69_00070 [Bacteroidetes bacterium RBG_13_44_24]|nr:MAG: hypothetical protein A2Z69_00070 [Bacteroidetes bacterium RBG_13_44_24]